MKRLLPLLLDCALWLFAVGVASLVLYGFFDPIVTLNH